MAWLASMVSTIEPCRKQVREAPPQILAIAARLRDGTPVEARGVANLKLLLTDGAGPCYVRSHPHALAEPLRRIAGWLDGLE